MAVAMAPPLYTSTVKGKLYSCDDNGAQTFWERWWVDIEGEYQGESSHRVHTQYGIASHYIASPRPSLSGARDETSLV